VFAARIQIPERREGIGTQRGRIRGVAMHLTIQAERSCASFCASFFGIRVRF
jgi:hypothetical protein